MDRFNVTVFCASSPHGPRETEFLAMAERFGRLLAKNGFGCMNGGNMGMMTALCRGAHQAGGHVHGILLRPSTYPTEHAYHTVVEHFDKIVPRQERLIAIGQAYVALPGGVGTFYEILQILGMKPLDEIDQETPLIIVGDTWKHLKLQLETIVAHGLCYRDPLPHINFVDTVEDAIGLLVAFRDKQ